MLLQALLHLEAKDGKDTLCHVLKIEIFTLGLKV
jgi:hypothetical protein